MLTKPTLIRRIPLAMVAAIAAIVMSSAVVATCVYLASRPAELTIAGRTTRTDDLIVDDTSQLSGVTTFGDPGPGRGWYVTNNELNQGYGYAAGDIGFLNYSSQAAGASQFRSLWIGNGKQAAAPILYVNGVNNRVGVNTASPTQSFTVSGTMEATGLASLTGGASSSAGTLSWGPLGGNGGLMISPSTGSAYFEPLTSSANPWGFGFNTPAPSSLIGMASLPYAPGTANPRTDDNVTLMNGLALSNYNTTAADIFVTDIFFDSSHTKAAGANALNNVLMRLDANGPLHGGGVRHATALWIDKGEFRNSGHTTYAVRPSTGGGPTAPPAVSACGTSPSSSGNDNGGTITVGATPGGTCTLTFQLTWIDYTGASIVPSCLVQSPQGVTFTYTPSATNLVIAWASGSPTTIVYHCFGRDDAVTGP